MFDLKNTFWSNSIDSTDTSQIKKRLFLIWRIFFFKIYLQNFFIPAVLIQLNINVKWMTMIKKTIEHSMICTASDFRQRLTIN